MTPARAAALRAMAWADESPCERDIARAILAEAGVPVEPPRPPGRQPAAWIGTIALAAVYLSRLAEMGR